MVVARGYLVKNSPKQKVYREYKWENKKSMGVSSHAQTRFGRNASDYDLHEMAGGLPLQTVSAPNIHHISKYRREVCNQVRKSNIPL